MLRSYNFVCLVDRIWHALAEYGLGPIVWLYGAELSFDIGLLGSSTLVSTIFSWFMDKAIALGRSVRNLGLCNYI